MELLRTRHLSKTYRDNGIPVQALTDINLVLEQGEFTVIAGPSGSGKTTLLNLLGTLDSPTSGEVYFEGNNLNARTRPERSRFRLEKLGFIFQAYNLIPVLTALENIEFTMVLLGIPAEERRKKALAIMEEMNIRALADKRPNEMSGGQQQRVAVGRAIVTNPLIVLADEPTANLDSATASDLLDIMEHMNTEHSITFLFSSHDPEVIRRGRRLILLRDGKIEREERR